MVRAAAIALGCLLAVLAGRADAQDLDKGKEAAWRGDYAAALSELRPLAAQGNAEAQYSLANFYRDGRGVARDEAQAAKWYRRAAEGGSWWAAFDLGMLYWGQSSAVSPAPDGADDALIRVHMWLSIAAATEVVGCVEISAPLRDAVAQSMTPAQLAEAEALARAWLDRHQTAQAAAAAKPTC